MTERFEHQAARPAAARGLTDAALEEINRAWTVLRAFSNTAHDVNNALQVIAGSAELLEAQALDPAIRRRVEIISAEAAKASATINRLLSYSQSGRSLPRNVNLRSVVQDAIALRAASAGRSRIQLSSGNSDGHPCRATADAARILQALLNVLFTAEDLVRQRANARIAVSASTKDGAVRMTITATADSGPNGEARPGEDPAGGLTAGAQLWAAANIVEAEGGQLSLAPAAGGQAFVVTLPAAP